MKTNYLKNLCKISLVAGMLLFTNASVAQTVIFSEDFNSITTGDNTTLTGSDTAWTRNSNFATAFRTFQAGGALRLGNGNSSANLGYIVTNRLDLSVNGGIFTVSFDVKGWTTVENQVKVLITGIEHQFVTYTATINQDFERVTLYYTGGVANSTITIESTEKRAFIDNILVATTPDDQILAATVATAPTDITSTSFTANWGGVAGATGYLLDVSTSLEFSTYVDGYHDLAVTGTTSQPVTGLSPNTQYFYRIRSTNANVTSITSNVMGATTAVLGIDSFNKLGLQYHPNPVNDVLNLSAIKNINSVVIYNIMGQTVLGKTLNTASPQIDMSALKAGYYFIKVASGTDSAVIKVVKR